SPGRFTFGVGVGGEDPAEYAAAGVPHRERGARADEALALLEKLRTGAEVTHRGRFFDLDAVAIRPAIPDLRVLVGGRSDAALTRAARFGSGWIRSLGLRPPLCGGDRARRGEGGGDRADRSRLAARAPGLVLFRPRRRRR